MQPSQIEWFESWFGSPYYHLLYQNRDEVEASAFVSRLVDFLQPVPGSSMLDIACGEGRFSIQLASRGFDVTGIDLSQASIEKAKQSEHDHLHFMVQDMRYPFYINYFDYAFNFFTSFGYFATDRDHQNAAKAFAKGLKKGGVLVMDYLNRDYASARLVAQDEVTRGGITFRLRRHLEEKHFVKNIRFQDEGGRELEYTERVAAFTLGDFIDLFTKAGLSLSGTFGDYQLNPYHPTDMPRMIMVFKK